MDVSHDSSSLLYGEARHNSSVARKRHEEERSRLVVDFGNGTVRYEDEIRELTGPELKVVEVMLEEPGKTIPDGRVQHLLSVSRDDYAWTLQEMLDKFSSFPVRSPILRRVDGYCWDHEAAYMVRR